MFSYTVLCNSRQECHACCPSNSISNMLIYKQRNANVTCDLRLQTVSVPFVHSVMQTNQELPSLIPMKHHQLELLTFRRRLHKGSLIETWWGKEKKLLRGQEPLFFLFALQDLRQKEFSTFGTMAVLTVKAARQQLLCSGCPFQGTPLL